jgi:sortase A
MWRFPNSFGLKETVAPKGSGQRSGRTVMLWSERVLFVSGLALVLCFGALRIEGWLTSRAALQRFAASKLPPESSLVADGMPVAAGEPSESSQPLELPEVDFHLWDVTRTKAYQQSTPGDSGALLGVLHIAKIGLDAPLFEGTDALVLNHGVGRIAGTSRPGETGNIGIAGHRDGFFRGLKDVSAGDAIELRTQKGTATYIVNEVRIVSPEHVEVLEPTSAPALTLVTCYPFYFLGSAPQRYIVTAFLAPEKNGDSESVKLRTPATTGNSIRRKQMKLFNHANLLAKGAGAFVLGLLALGTAVAQDSTVTTIVHGESSFDTQVKNAEVVYVEGNDLVLRLENGRIEHLVVPDSDQFTIDGEQLTVRELVPGTKLTQSITTTNTPRYVNKVRTIEGKVWHVNPPNSVILTMPDNNNQLFNIPSHAKFTIDGREKTAFDLKKGMKIKATIVSDEEHTIVESNKVASGQAPRIVATPREIGLLLFSAPRPPVLLADAGKAAETLPDTGSTLPMVGLLGAFTLAAALALRTVRWAGRI